MYRSAISASHLSVDGCSIGSHQLVSHFMKSIYKLHPSQPQVFTIWDVGTVLRYLKTFHPAGTLSLKMSTLKLVMLSALVSASRCSYLYQFDLKYHYIKNGNYFVAVAGLVKGFRLEKPQYQYLHTNIYICIPISIPVYLYTDKFVFLFFLRIQPCAVSVIVMSILGGHKHKDQILLVKTYCSCLNYIKPHKVVKICTIAQWVKKVLSLSGIDISQFSVHLAHSASTSNTNF